MGTIDDGDSNAVFMGTLDDGDSVFGTSSDPTAAAAAAAAAPKGSRPELAFLYDPAAVAAIVAAAPEVVRRCNGVIRECSSMDDVLAVVRWGGAG